MVYCGFLSAAFLDRDEGMECMRDDLGDLHPQLISSVVRVQKKENLQNTSSPLMAHLVGK